MESVPLDLPRGSRILVTGANERLHCLACRREITGTWYGPRSFETVIVTSFEDKSTVERALDEVDGVVHLASDLSFNSDPNAVIPWVVQATLNILELAARRASIKRVVLVSSSTAAYMIFPDPNRRDVHANTWNDVAVAKAWDEKTPANEKGLTVYAASKTEGERQSWKWIEENHPQFVFNTVLPSFSVGRILHPEIPGSMMGSARQLLTGDPTAVLYFGKMAKLFLEWYVEVEDVARLCVIGLVDPKVKSERIFAFAEQKHWADTVAILRDLRPNNTSIPDVPLDIPRDQTVIHRRDRAEKLLRDFYGQPGFTPIKESIERGIEGWS
ncbi:NAD dependent epimerase/dehydratase [Aspergillus sclerotiicarbonarius CBS 121057]|uniref:NAD dependent epimerase/dehydratase n=1 Tax=Aspergillus sclerotiicarbonarius (strain CBS 121057 / IBT 28362) TaxID=1448318 RepID=A0A319EGI0_ASPSB|nr:NAD dependent epimerase/dehydratase [Aspergillus sclerotiicarbonarius CBS 121057]